MWMFCFQAHREGGNRGYFPGAPKLLRDKNHENKASMSECLGRIISNGFTVSVVKHFDVRQILLINCPRLLYFFKLCPWNLFPGPPLLFGGPVHFLYIGWQPIYHGSFGFRKTFTSDAKCWMREFMVFSRASSVLQLCTGTTTTFT